MWHNQWENSRITTVGLEGWVWDESQGLQMGMDWFMVSQCPIEQTASTSSASARNHWAPLGLSQVHWCWLLITIGVWMVYLPKISYPSVNYFFFVRIPWLNNLLSCDWEVNVYDYHYLPMHVGSDPFHCGLSWFATLRLPRSETFCAENIIMI